MEKKCKWFMIKWERVIQPEKRKWGELNFV